MLRVHPIAYWHFADRLYRIISSLTLVVTSSMSDRPLSPPEEGGYSLAALFVFTAACAVPMALMGAMMRGVREGEISAAQAAFAACACGGVGLIVGLIVGAHHYRQPRGVLLGALTGLVIGISSGPLILLKSNQTAGLVAAGCLGAIVLVAVSAALRMITRPPSDDTLAKQLTNFDPPAVLRLSPEEANGAATPAASG